MILTSFKTNRKKLKKILIIIVFLFLIHDAILAYNNLQAQTAIVGLKVNGRNITGFTAPQIEQVIKQEVIRNNRPLKFSYKNHVIVVNQNELDAKVNIKQITNKLLKVGRRGNLFRKLFDQHQAFLGFKNEKIIGIISQGLLTLKLLQFQDQINQDATPPMPDFVHDINKTLPAHEGIKVDTNKLTIIIANNIFNPPKTQIPIPTLKVFPLVYKENELDPIRKDAIAKTKESISITSGGQTFLLSSKDIRSLLTIVERPDTLNPKKEILVLRLDDKKLNRKLGVLAVQVESETHAEFNDHDARVAIYSQFYSNKRWLISIPTGRALVNKKVLGEQTQPGPKNVYLTFDDGPNSIYHPLVLDILEKNNVKATFFLVGQNSQRDPQITIKTVEDGHVIGNHSLTHAFLPNLSQTSILNEIQTTNNILKPFNRNSDIKLFRPPYGGVNLYVKKYSDDLGLKLTLWDVDPRDWSEPDTDELVRRVVENTINGSDILLHSNHLATVKALPKIIETLKSKDFTFLHLP